MDDIYAMGLCSETAIVCKELEKKPVALVRSIVTTIRGHKTEGIFILENIPPQAVANGQAAATGDFQSAIPAFVGTLSVKCCLGGMVDIQKA